MFLFVLNLMGDNLQNGDKPVRFVEAGPLPVGRGDPAQQGDQFSPAESEDGQ